MGSGLTGDLSTRSQCFLAEEAWVWADRRCARKGVEAKTESGLPHQENDECDETPQCD